MENVDYIIVGAGYAGMFMAHQLIKNNKSFVIFSNGKQAASEVSAGIINPAILKKFTSFWLAQEQIDSLHSTLNEIEKYTGKNYFIHQPVHRIFHDEIERNLWLRKSEDEVLSSFLGKDFISYEDVRNPFSTGEVLQSGRLNVHDFFSDMKSYLHCNGYLLEEDFNYKLLNPEEKQYKNFAFQHLVFCEGIAVKNNPFFSGIPIDPNKGHHLKVTLSKPLSDQVTFKKKHFLFPVENGQYYYGGTYDRDHTDVGVDSSAVQQLESGLSEFYPESFETNEILYGFRPTVKDRRPIIGQHPKYDNLYVFNGLGARGILNGNYFAQELFQHIEYGESLHPEVDLNRFKIEH